MRRFEIGSHLVMVRCHWWGKTALGGSGLGVVVIRPRLCWEVLRAHGRCLAVGRRLWLLQGGCFCVARRWMWRGPHEFEVMRCLEGQDLALISGGGRVIDDYGHVARG